LEAVINAVVHADRGRPQPGQVDGEASRLDDALCVFVRDQGSGLTARYDSPRLGLGMALMARFAERLEVRAVSGGGTATVLRFHSTASAAVTGAVVEMREPHAGLRPRLDRVGGFDGG
jgi:anti-sigma regulatory factor (Ser/Thr protein kinase)